MFKKGKIILLRMDNIFICFSNITYSTRHFCHDLELGGGDLISSPVDSIASLVSPKKSYGPNSVGKNYFSATPFFTFSKNATGGHNA